MGGIGGTANGGFSIGIGGESVGKIGLIGGAGGVIGGASGSLFPSPPIAQGGKSGDDFLGPPDELDVPIESLNYWVKMWFAAVANGLLVDFAQRPIIFSAAAFAEVTLVMRISAGGIVADNCVSARLSNKTIKEGC